MSFIFPRDRLELVKGQLQYQTHKEKGTHSCRRHNVNLVDISRTYVGVELTRSGPLLLRVIHVIAQLTWLLPAVGGIGLMRLTLSS